MFDSDIPRHYSDSIFFLFSQVKKRGNVCPIYGTFYHYPSTSRIVLTISLQTRHCRFPPYPMKPWPCIGIVVSPLFVDRNGNVSVGFKPVWECSRAFPHVLLLHRMENQKCAANAINLFQSEITSWFNNF